MFQSNMFMAELVLRLFSYYRDGANVAENLQPLLLASRGDKTS